MNMTNSERRLIENELVFRQFNESIQDGVEQVNRIAAEEGHHPIELDNNMPLHFYCECADENCKLRIRLSPDMYNRIHVGRDIFIIVPGHEVTAVEDVISQRKNYSIVKKHTVPPMSVTGLNKTDVDNV